MRACQDAVKAGRSDGGTAGCEVSGPRLDGIEHCASLERTEAAVVPADFLVLYLSGTDDHVAKSGARG